MKLKRTSAILKLTNEQMTRKNNGPVSTRIRRKCVNLALTTRTMGDVAVVHCGGSLVFQKEAAALCDLVSDLVRRYRSIVLDLNEVSAIDGGGIGTLAECIRNAKESGARLVLCRVPRKVRTLLDLTRVSSLVEIAPTENDALRRTGAAA
jgi:anti-anti-sigma factor